MNIYWASGLIAGACAVAFFSVVVKIVAKSYPEVKENTVKG